jgi:transcriptional regulator with XRE-family HTH domain
MVPEPYRNSFVARVREAREKANYLQTEIAELLGTTQPTYSKYEGRMNEPSTLLPHHLIEKFCALTGVTIEWLITGADLKTGRTPR